LAEKIIRVKYQREKLANFLSANISQVLSVMCHQR